MVDSGAAVSIIKHEKIDAGYIDRENSVSLRSFSGDNIQTLGSIRLRLTNRKARFSYEFQVIGDETSLQVDGIIGSDWLAHFGADICYSDYTMRLGLKGKPRAIPLNRREGILFRILEPRTRNYIQILTQRKGEIFIDGQELSENVTLYGNTQKPKDGTLTMVIDNATDRPFVLKEFVPNMKSMCEFETFSLSEVQKEHENIFGTTIANEAMVENKFVNEILKKLDFETEDPEIKKYVIRLCTEFQGMMHLEGQATRAVENFEHRIYVKPNTVPFYVKQYRLAPTTRKIIAEKIDKMVEQGLAEPSTSPYNSPLLLVKKKGAESQKDYRLVIDYRKLNDVIEDDKFMIQSIEDIFDGLSGSKWYTTIDLNQGYYQIKLAKESRPYTAFTTENGHFQLKRMPMGLKTSPSNFTRIMQTVLGKYVGKICYIYMDDVIIYSSDKQQHAEDLTTILRALNAAGFQIKPQKCEFFKTSVSYLGHVISSDGILPDPEKYKTITNWPKPKTMKDVQSFLGLVNYYRRFVRKFAEIANPLYRLTKKDVEFKWEPDCQEAFDCLKEKITSAEVLEFPNFNRPFLLQCDSSSYALGAVLMNENKRPVAFISRPLRNAELNYHITDKELLAIVWAIKKFRTYLYGNKFVIETDHQALEHLFKLKDPTGRLMRYRLKLEEFDFVVRYIKGEKNAVADALSRVQMDIQDLKNLQCNVLTRLQKQREKERQEEEQKEEQNKGYEEIRKDSTSTVTRVLRKIEGVPLLRLCESFEEMLGVSDKEVFADEKRLVGYFPELGIIMLKYPPQLTEATLKDDMSSVKASFLNICKKAGMKKIAIMQSELSKIKVDKRKFLRFLGEEKGTVIEFYVFPDPEHIEDESTQKEILQTAHFAPTGGHWGVNKMLRTLKLKYYWPKMALQIRKLVKNCKSCQINKHSTERRIPMSITDTSSKSFEKVFCDIVGPLPTSHNGNKYILTVQDDLTKFLQVFPIPDKSAESVARTLVEKFFLKYMIPRKIVHDCGTDFMNDTLEEVCKLMKVEKKASAPYHHETVGALERSHKSLGNYLRNFTNEDKQTWDEWLPYFTYAYNSVVHTSTGFTPFELVFGQQQLIVNVKQSEIPMSLDDYDKELKARLRLAWDQAKTCVNKEKEKRKKLYDQRFSSNEKEIEMGDYVLIKSQTGDKLDKLYEGPFEVMKTDETNVYVMKRGRVQKIHKNNVKIFYSMLNFWLENY